MAPLRGSDASVLASGASRPRQWTVTDLRPSNRPSPRRLNPKPKPKPNPTQLNPTQLNSTQPNSTQLNSTQIKSNQLKSNQINPKQSQLQPMPQSRHCSLETSVAQAQRADRVSAGAVRPRIMTTRTPQPRRGDINHYSSHNHSPMISPLCGLPNFLL